jgi:hypothetical protein
MATAEGYGSGGHDDANHQRGGHQQMRQRNLAFRQRPGVAIGVMESDPGDPIPGHDVQLQRCESALDGTIVWNAGSAPAGTRRNASGLVAI